MAQGVWLLALVALPGAALVVSLLGRPGDTRVVPADCFKLGVCVALPWAVDVSLGVLATLAAGWWAVAWWNGTPWELAEGGTLWPAIAAGIWLGTSAPWWTVRVALVGLVVMGFGQLVYAVVRRTTSGTLGHRTMFGTYLAVVSPLAVMATGSVVPALLFGLGVIASRSFTAAAAWGVGMVVVEPRWAPAIVLLAFAGLASRALKFSKGRWTFRRFVKTWRARPGVNEGRLIVWRQAIGAMTPLAWLIGHGPGSFQRDAPIRAHASGSRELFREAHNDYLEHVYEYGLIGVLAAVWWVWRFGGFHITDPLTGAAAALGVAMTTSFPLKVAPVACVGVLIAILLMRRSSWV